MSFIQQNVCDNQFWRWSIATASLIWRVIKCVVTRLWERPPARAASPHGPRRPPVPRPLINGLFENSPSIGHYSRMLDARSIKPFDLENWLSVVLLMPDIKDCEGAVSTWILLECRNGVSLFVRQNKLFFCRCSLREHITLSNLVQNNIKDKVRRHHNIT